MFSSRSLFDLTGLSAASGGPVRSTSGGKRPLPLARERMTPTVPLGLFDLREAVGAGAMARVWRAEHRGLGVSVAVKVLTQAESPDVPILFAHEVRAVARLSHPGIIRLHDHGVIPAETAARTGLPDGAPFLVMEWLPGGSLRQRAGTMGWPEVRRTLLVLLDALSHAHARGVIHRDLKPDNVLLAERGPVLTDFGVAASLEETQGSKLLVGTPNYMAPEQIRGDWHALGPWTDLYAVGCLAWQLVTGAAPFAGRGRQEVLKAHLRHELPAFEPRIEVPAGFEGWVRGLLGKLPRERPRFAAIAAASLLALADGGTLDDVLSVVTPPEEGTQNAVPARWRGPASPAPPLPLPGVGRALVSLREVELKGRDEERDSLWRALRRVAERGRPGAVLLVGPSGYGKSRLAAWLSRRAHELGVAETLVARHARQTGPSCGVGPMLARALRTGDLTGDDVLVRISEVMGEGEDDTALVPALAALTGGIGSFSGAGERLVLGSEAERHATLRQGLARLAHGRPLVLHLDDLQWGLEAIRFTRSLLEAPDAPPVLVVATVRDDVLTSNAPEAVALAGLRTLRAVRTLPVGPLAPDVLAAICRAMLPLGAEVVDRLVQRAEGSPLFAEELIRHWIRTEALESTPTGFRLRAGAEGDVPEAVGTLWQARIAEVLGPDEQARHACELAAALGPVINPAEWKAICSVAGVAQAPDLPERLQAAGLLVRDTADGPLRFAHVMAREALRQSARDGDRWARWNAHCATFLGPFGDVERQAHHLLAARRLREALGPLDAAARRHLERAEPLRARRLILARVRALRALRVPRQDAAWIETRVAWAEQAAASGNARAATRHGRRALAEARPLGQECLVGRALVVLGRMARQGGQAEAGLIALEEALEVAERRADCHLLTAARLETLWSLVQGGRLAEADALARRVLTTKASVEPSQLAEARYAVATLAWRRGRIHQAELYGEAAFSGYREAGARTGMAHAACLLGDVARARGAFAAARERYQEGLALLDAAGGAGRGLVLCNLGQAWLALEDRVAARAAFIEARQEAARGTDRELRAVVDFFLLVCDALAGRWRACEGRLGVFLVLRDQTPEADVVAQAPVLARLAEAAGNSRVADPAWTLAEQWLLALGRDADARALQAERLAATQARTRGLFVRPPTREPRDPAPPESTGPRPQK